MSEESEARFLLEMRSRLDIQESITDSELSESLAGTMFESAYKLGQALNEVTKQMRIAIFGSKQ